MRFSLQKGTAFGEQKAGLVHSSKSVQYPRLHLARAVGFQAVSLIADSNCSLDGNPGFFYVSARKLVLTGPQNPAS